MLPKLQDDLTISKRHVIYDKVLKFKPIAQITNKNNQTFDIISHESGHSVYPVILIFHPNKCAVSFHFIKYMDILNDNEFMPFFDGNTINFDYQIKK